MGFSLALILVACGLYSQELSTKTKLSANEEKLNNALSLVEKTTTAMTQQGKQAIADKAQAVAIAQNSGFNTLISEQDHIISVLTTLTPELHVYKQGVYVVIDLPQATFNPSSNYLPPSSLKDIQLLASVFQHYDGTYYMMVEGYTDNTKERGQHDYDPNLSIGADRAIHVAHMLTEAGIPANKLGITSWGENNPLHYHATPTADPANRRVDLVFAPSRSSTSTTMYAPLATADIAKLKTYAAQYVPVPAITSVPTPAPAPKPSANADAQMLDGQDSQASQSQVMVIEVEKTVTPSQARP